VGPTGSPQSHKKQHIGAIVGGVIDGVAAIFVVIGVIFFVRHRRRRAGPKSVLSSRIGSWETGPEAIVTPFDPNLTFPEATRDTDITPEQQPLVGEDPDTEMVAALHSLSESSSPPAVLPFPQPEEPVPVGLSAKEIARLRAQTLGSRQSQTRLTLNVSQPEASTSSESAATGNASSSYDTRRLHSEVESLRREMERLRAEGLVTEAPPSYTEGDR
jgi:hypothetical protein